jgi:HEAT repeat protein
MFVPMRSYADQIDKNIEELGKENTPAQFVAVNDLLNSGQQVKPKIVAGLTNKNPIIRKQCIVLLRRMKDRDSFVAIRDLALNDTDWLVREQAITALGEYKSSDTIPTLIQTANLDSVVNNRVTAIRFLSYSAGKKSMPHLKKILKNDASLIVKLNAARELARFGDASGYKLASDSISNSDWGVRHGAAGVLGYVGNESDLPILNQMLKNKKEDGAVRREVYFAIHHIQLIHMPEPTQLSFLGDSLGDPHNMLREWAARELVARKDQKTRKLITDILAQPNHPGRMEAQGVLERLNE